MKYLSILFLGQYRVPSEYVSSLNIFLLAVAGVSARYTTLCRDSQLCQSLSANSFTVAGIEIVIRLLQFLNASAANLLTVGGMVHDVREKSGQ